MVIISDMVHSRILAVDATRPRQHNRGEWMGAKRKERRGFVKVHALADTQALKILASAGHRRFGGRLDYAQGVAWAVCIY